MSTTTTAEIPSLIPVPVINTVVGVATAGIGIPPPPSKPDEEKYRWYRCEFDKPLHTTCYAIPVSEMHETKSYPTRLYPIGKWVPKVFDKGILRFNLFTDRSVSCVTDTETKSPTKEQ